MATGNSQNGTPQPQQLAGQSVQLPGGGVVRGVEIQQQKAFSPELQIALRKARDEVGDRYMVAVFTTDADGKTTHLNLTRGSNWTDDWFLRSYRLFLSQFLHMTPEMVAAVVNGPQSGANAAPPSNPTPPEGV